MFLQIYFALSMLRSPAGPQKHDVLGVWLTEGANARLFRQTSQDTNENES